MSRIHPTDRFETVMERGDAGRPRHGLKVVCQVPNCGASMVMWRNGKHFPPTDQVITHFTRAGWTMAQNNNRRDKCPACSEAHRREVDMPLIERETTVLDNGMPPIGTPAPNPAPLALVPPRAPDRDERRRILSELEAVYDPTKSAYIGAINDQAVAEKLKLPRAWVAEVREQFFGPEINEDTLRAQTDLVAWLAKLKTIEDKALAVAAEAEAARKEIAALMKRIA